MDDLLRDLYQEVILDHGKHPRNLRHPEGANRQARGYNPLCGDQVTIYLVEDEDGRIADVAFEGKGCAISMASASMMTEVLRGKTEAEARRLFDDFHRLCTEDGFTLDQAYAEDREALERLQVLSGVRAFPVRVKCATLAWHAMTAALDGEGQATTE
ncbi:Fe-S cluster assembly sulfur transfer protein SufU [Pelagibius marinus]|uniref:Fe-S cluster assembly sulfur transfer protein SufU n=1 Tax=Pelagibius marinus TaxID=2762760 RepID=UPI0018727484|nr:SUF system NifU family Fe-S cluster assembly protein [Pelagibius marinus]